MNCDEETKNNNNKINKNLWGWLHNVFRQLETAVKKQI